MTFESVEKHLQVRQKFFNGFENKVFSIKKSTQGTGFKIVTPKQMIQGLPIVLALIKAGNISEFTNLLIYLLKYVKLHILYIKQKKLVKQYLTI